MEVRALEIPEVLILKPARFGDDRGFFSETYNRARLAEVGIHVDFVQDNHSLSAEPLTLRGLHFQSPPHAQTKLVRVARGRIFDVAVDIRHGAPSFGKWVGAEISAAEWNQILVPQGFAHGFLTLEPDTEVLYKVDDYYAPEHDRGLAWDDPAIGIDWPLSGGRPVLSDKDRRHPALAELPRYFDMAGLAG